MSPPVLVRSATPQPQAPARSTSRTAAGPRGGRARPRCPSGSGAASGGRAPPGSRWPWGSTWSSGVSSSVRAASSGVRKVLWPSPKSRSACSIASYVSAGPEAPLARPRASWRSLRPVHLVPDQGVPLHGAQGGEEMGPGLWRYRGAGLVGVVCRGDGSARERRPPPGAASRRAAACQVWFPWCAPDTLPFPVAAGPSSERGRPPRGFPEQAPVSLVGEDQPRRWPPPGRKTRTARKIRTARAATARTTFEYTETYSVTDSQLSPSR